MRPNTVIDTTLSVATQNTYSMKTREPSIPNIRSQVSSSAARSIWRHEGDNRESAKDKLPMDHCHVPTITEALPVIVREERVDIMPGLFQTLYFK